MIKDDMGSGHALIICVDNHVLIILARHKPLWGVPTLY